MIVNTGQRTDIPAFFAPWLANRLRAGSVCVRNPFNPQQVSRYRLSPDVVDVIGFCTKNPEPLFPYFDALEPFGQFWYITITPYGRDIEPAVPNKHRLLRVFRELSARVGPQAVCWRYDPILLSPVYTKAYHLRAFETMATALEGATDTVTISFIQIYDKLRRNFPEAAEVALADRVELAGRLAQIAAAHSMTVRLCPPDDRLATTGVANAGCMTLDLYERAIGSKLDPPAFKPARDACACYLGCDIGAYSTCPHLCRYCYAHSDARAVAANRARHDPASPFLIGGPEHGDRVHDVPQRSWKVDQLSLF
jgi:hypothetical protein